MLRRGSGLLAWMGASSFFSDLAAFLTLPCAFFLDGMAKRMNLLYSIERLLNIIILRVGNGNRKF
jgi:hypothetical protein